METHVDKVSNRFSLEYSNAFWALWQEQKPNLFILSMRLLRGRREDAEDVLSAAAIKACERFAAEGGHIHNRSAYLLRLVHNLCVDEFRQWRVRTLRFESLETLVAAEMPVARQTADSPEEEVLRRELSRYTWEAIRRLPTHLRDAYILRCLEGFDYSDIATRCTLSQENVRKRVQQARAILRGKLNAYFQTAEGPRYDA